MLWPFALAPSLRSTKPLVQWLRSGLMIVTTGFNFVALRYLQLDQTVTKFFLTPLIVARCWAASRRMDRLVLHGGGGGRLPRRAPCDASRLRLTTLGELLALVATFGYALYNLATRYLAAFDPARVTQTYTPLAGFLVMAPFAFAEWQWTQDLRLWILFASLGFWGGLGRWLLIIAHRSARASVLAPFIYLGLIWMSAAGFLIFGNLPTLWTLSGAAIVILSGLYLLARERKIVGVAGPASDIATQ